MMEEIKIFFTALMFYTRIPCPSWVDHDPEYITKATRYFPLIGLIVGGISFLVYVISSYLFGSQIGIWLMIISAILTTGAFHEDGFADVCDGFGGGWTKEKILEIMKDSRIGTYGGAGLILILIGKIFLWSTLSQYFKLIDLGILIIATHILSRWAAVWVIYLHEYAREDQDSKAKPIAINPPKFNLLIATFFAILALLGISFINPLLCLSALCIPISSIYLGRYFQKWIGGYTGDCLGATQQVNEILIPLIVLALWKFI